MSLLKKVYITPQEIADDLGVSNQRAHQIIKAQGFDTERLARSMLVFRADYNLYRRQRMRTELARYCGRGNRHLLRSTQHDTQCPVCGAYAVSWKGATACINGHQYNYGEPSKGEDN